MQSHESLGMGRKKEADMAQRMERGMRVANVVAAGLMDTLFVVFVILAWLTLGTAQGADPPKTIVFETKMGNVTFEHAKHQERVKGDCAVCHEKLFKQSREPINYKPGMHKPAEANKTACAGCHHAGGMAFESKGNCNTCHQKK
jgi:c(7)-type cytochrome triheme protein